MKKPISFVICVALIICLLSGCTIISDKKELIPFKGKESFVPTGTVAQDGDLQLYWDAERCSLAVLKNGKAIWASMPLEQYNNNNKTGAVKKYIESHIFVSYKDYKNNSIFSVNSYIGAYEDGRVYSYLVDKGIRILYCFDKQCFAIPVIYRLIDGHLDVMLENKSIYESANQVYEVSLLPYSCATENEAENKIFVPDGSGMIMNCDAGRQQRSYSAKIYGEDGAESSNYKFVYEQAVKLPVFAVSGRAEGNYCLIVTGGEPAASINAAAGDTTIGFSYAYASFKLRGAETVQVPQGWGKVSISRQYSDIAKLGKMQMRIAFLENDSSFMNVADYYRDYLIKEKGLKAKKGDRPLYLDIPMALSQREFIFGFPRNKTVPVTDFSEAQQIFKDVKKTTGISPAVRLLGVQQGGLEISKVAGGFKTEPALGTKSEFEKMLKTAKSEGIDIYPDFDITRFRKSANGYSVKSDAVKRASSRLAIQSFVSLSTGGALKNEYSYALLSPYNFPSVSQRLLDFLKKSGSDKVSLSTFGNTAYSDYGYEQGYMGADYLYQSNVVGKMFAKSKTSVMYDSANQFAAVNASCIVNSPTESSWYYSQDSWIPFYQIVFKGYIPMSGASITLSDDAEDELLRSVQCGIGLLVSACGRETGEFSTSKFDVLSVGSYENVKEIINSSVSKTAKFIKSVENCTITDFSRVSEKVYLTEFSNGIKVLVNYSDKDFAYGQISVGGKSFTVMDEV